MLISEKRSMARSITQVDPNKIMYTVQFPKRIHYLGDSPWRDFSLDCIEWCLDNIGHSGDDTWYYYSVGRCFRFADEKDALVFKLIWCTT